MVGRAKRDELVKGLRQPGHRSQKKDFAESTELKLLVMAGEEGRRETNSFLSLSRIL